MSVEVICPYCGESTEVTVDEAGGRSVEDCVVCCHPIDVYSAFDEDGEVSVRVSRADG